MLGTDQYYHEWIKKGSQQRVWYMYGENERDKETE